MNLESFLEMLKKYDVEGFENVQIEGDLEIEVEGENINLSMLMAYLPIIQEFQGFLYHANAAISFISNFLKFDNTVSGNNMNIKNIKN